MPRRKQNVDAFGKSWSPIDLPNLEKAVRLYERLNYLQDHFAGSLSGANKIMAQINEQAEIKEELQKLGIKHNEEELKQIIKLIQQRQTENRMLDAGIKGSTSGVINYRPTQSLYGPATSYYKPTNVNGQVNSSNLGNIVASGLMNRRMVSSEMQRMRDAGSIMSDASLRRAAQINVQNGNAVMTKELEKFGGKMSAVGSIFQVAVNTFSEAVHTFSGLFFKGLRAQSDIYEQTFTNVSVRTGMTRGQYLYNQTNAASNLYSRGLAGNVKMSDVQKTWDTLASTGMGQEKIIANAIDTVITQTIVPYLNANDAYFQQLVEQQPALMKQIRGIGAATQEVSGSSVFINKYLQDMIDSLSPMAAVAENELGVQYAQMSGAYESLRAQGLSDAAIGSMYKGAAAVYRDPLAALRSGNLDNQLAVVNGIVNGIDFRDAAQVNGQYIGAANFVSHLTPGGRMAPIFAGMSNTALDTMTKVELRERNLNIAQALSNGKLVGSRVNSVGDRKTEDFQNNVNNTLKQIQENELENASTWLAAIYEQIGYWGDILAVLVKGIAGVVGAKIIGGIGKKILGLGGKAGGTGLAAGLKNLGGGLATSTTGSIGAGLAVAGGALAGGAMAIKGGVDIYKDLSSGEGWTGKTTASAIGVAGGAAGAGALIALGASNPIGWAALAIGGIALAGRAIYEHVEAYNKSMESAMNEYETQIENQLAERKANQAESMLQLEVLREQIEKTDDLEVIKNKLVDAGITTQEKANQAINEAKDANISAKDALLKLTDEYIAKTKELNEKSNVAFEALATYESGKNSVYADKVKDFMQYIVKGGGQKKMYKMDESEREVATNTIKAISRYAEQDNVYSNLDKKSQKIINKIREYNVNNLSWEDVDDIINTMDSNKTEMNRLINSAFGNSDITQAFSLGFGNSWSGDKTRQRLGNLEKRIAIDQNGALQYLQAAMVEGISDEEARSYLDKFKAATYLYDYKDLPGEMKSVIDDIVSTHNLKSYRSGLSYVPYDNYLANLHQGEAVITAATANELRSLITEYRESQQMSTSLDAAIQTQTATLVNKIDEIIQVVQNNSLFKAPSQNKVKEMFNNMKYVRSTKSFNQ